MSMLADILGILSFFIGILGIYISIRLTKETNNISKKITLITTLKDYNKSRVTYHKKFKNHLETLSNSNSLLSSNLSTLLTDCHEIKINYRPILNNDDVKALDNIINNIDSNNLDYFELRGSLAYIVARLNKEENDYAL